MSHLDNDKLTEIYQKIKDNYLSKLNFPVLVVGTGLSICYGVAGMDALFEKLNSNFDKSDTPETLKNQWLEIKSVIKKYGLEKGLEKISDSEFINFIRKITSMTIVEDLNNRLFIIKEEQTGFKKMVSFLKNSCSENNKIIDIMTPNYDLIIELICDDLNLKIIDGFIGNMFEEFNKLILGNPKSIIFTNKNHTYVRLFKPHGSINWIFKGERIIKTNNFNELNSNINNIAIIPPGGDKYRQGMTIKECNDHREEFNKILADDINRPVIIYGYGFNDDHFNSTILGEKERKMIVITKGLKSEIKEKLLENSNAVVFFQDNKINKLIYKNKEYEIEEQMWDINTFSKNFFR